MAATIRKRLPFLLGAPVSYTGPCGGNNTTTSTALLNYSWVLISASVIGDNDSHARWWRRAHKLSNIKFLLQRPAAVTIARSEPGSQPLQGPEARGLLLSEGACIPDQLSWGREERSLSAGLQLTHSPLPATDFPSPSPIPLLCPSSWFRLGLGILRVPPLAARGQAAGLWRLERWSRFCSRRGSGDLGGCPSRSLPWASGGHWTLGSRSRCKVRPGPAPARKAAARNWNINRYKLPGKIFVFAVDDPALAALRKKKPPGAGGREPGTYGNRGHLGPLESLGSIGPGPSRWLVANATGRGRARVCKPGPQRWSPDA